jgi:hypothetical protein
VALALDEVLGDGGCGVLARELLDDVLLLRGCEPLAEESPDREGRSGGGLLDVRCDFEKIVWMVVVLQLRKISIGYGVEEGRNCWTTPSAVEQTGVGHRCMEC